MRLFFCSFFKEKVFAQKEKLKAKNNCIWLNLAKETDKKLEPNFSQKVSQLCQDYENKNRLPKKITDREKNYNNLVKGYPIEIMIPAIALQDKNVSAFLISIAKKESNWGVHTPKKQGKECYNYWGYRGSYNQTASGYSCFDSPEQAVSVVGKRIDNLIQKKIDTPKKMVVWKCGSSCANFRHKDVQKWISDVSLYYNKINS